MMSKKRKTLIIILIIVILLNGIYLFNWIRKNTSSNKEEKQIKEVITSKASEESDYKMTQESFIELKDQYPNMVGYIEFPDDFMSEPIGQYEDNEYYLHHYIDDTLDDRGAVYMDYDCNPTNENITIYGHNVYFDDNARFSPLQKLETQEEYEKHNEFQIWYADHVSTYEIVYVTKYNVKTDKDFDFKIKNFYTDELFTSYKDWYDAHQLIDSGDMDIEIGDHLVTLQTCVRWETDNRFLVVGKEVARKEFATKNNNG